MPSFLNYGSYFVLISIMRNVLLFKRNKIKALKYCNARSFFYKTNMYVYSVCTVKLSSSSPLELLRKNRKLPYNKAYKSLKASCLRFFFLLHQKIKAFIAQQGQPSVNKNQSLHNSIQGHNKENQVY